MRVLLLVLILSGLWSCENNSSSQTTTPLTETKEPEETVLNNTYCFIASYGEDPTFQDTTSVKLTVIGNEVIGTYNWIPAGKDSARGSLTGTINNGIITAIYDYIIEGSKQKEEMIFKMEASQLLVKRGELEEIGDVLKLKDPDKAEFSEVIPRVLCK